VTHDWDALARGTLAVYIDGAPAMIAEAQAAFPCGDWRVMDLRQITLPGPYDGVLGWNSVFHLTQAEQRAVIPHLIRLVRPGGPLMITIGHGNGTATGTIAGHTVYHASLSPQEYRALLDWGAAVRQLRQNHPAPDEICPARPLCARAFPALQTQRTPRALQKLTAE